MPLPTGMRLPLLLLLLSRGRRWRRLAGAYSRQPPPARSLSCGGGGTGPRMRPGPPSSGCFSASWARNMSSKEFDPTFPTTDWKVAKRHLEEIDHAKRRCYYKAKRFVMIDEIQTWKDFSVEEKLKQPVTSYNKDDVLNEKISLLQEDITKLEIDAIVNAANSSLMGGGGVDGSIHLAAGPLLRDECATLNGCSPGDSKITSGYCLPAKYVVHTVGPFVQGKERLPEKVLSSCYIESLKLADVNGLRSIAFPCVSTGAYGYPNGQAAETALKAVRQYLEERRNSFDRIIFCVFLKLDYVLYKEKMPFYFPFGSQRISDYWSL
ncbi:ADP-ribose glycohydrolase MACROD1-like isoform X2 [Narcine bancroftii]|uniref:ADP-ribose glycohydrolase MACROD1-like isoform X2 n=1 Tax=Narcine bancroftii TaxID=1343680 RepID=UPI0038320BBA